MSRYVYLIKYSNTKDTHFDTHYKIGFAQHVESRMGSISGSSTFELIVIWKYQCIKYAEFEKWLHNYFNDHHIKGEWFNFLPEELDNVINILETHKTYFNGKEDIISIETYQIDEKIESEQIIEPGEIIEDSEIIEPGEIIDDSEGKKIFKCNKCNNTFASKQRLEYHLYETKIKCDEKNITEIDNKMMYKCTDCDKVYTRYMYLKTHKLNKHMEIIYENTKLLEDKN